MKYQLIKDNKHYWNW